MQMKLFKSSATCITVEYSNVVDTFAEFTMKIGNMALMKYTINAKLLSTLCDYYYYA